MQSFSYWKMLCKHNFDLVAVSVCFSSFSHTSCVQLSISYRGMSHSLHKCVVRNIFGLGYSIEWEVVTVMMICVPCRERLAFGTKWNFKFIDYFYDFPFAFVLSFAQWVSMGFAWCRIPSLCFNHLFFLYICYWYLTIE